MLNQQLVKDVPLHVFVPVLKVKRVYLASKVNEDILDLLVLMDLKALLVLPVCKELKVIMAMLAQSVFAVIVVSLALPVDLEMLALMDLSVQKEN